MMSIGVIPVGWRSLLREHSGKLSGARKGRDLEKVRARQGGMRVHRPLAYPARRPNVTASGHAPRPRSTPGLTYLLWPAETFAE